MIIDSHQHFWDVSRTDYGWLTPENTLLYRNYLPADLTPLLSANKIDGTVLVQAAPSEDETRYLLELARTHSFIAGVVGWVDFESPQVDSHITSLVEHGRGKLKGFRPMIQDIADPHWLRRPELDDAFQSMIRHDLVFEALVRPQHLSALRERLMRHRDLRAVLDHAGKPGIQQGAFEGWAQDIERLARDTAVSVKLSGILTEAGSRPSFDVLHSYIDHVIQCFGPGRILWGSDWPVLNLASDYGEWLKLSRDLVRRLAPDDAEAIFARTATRVYHLELQSNARHATTSQDLPV